MKSLFKSLAVIVLILLFGCKPPQPNLTDSDKAKIDQEVKDEFNKLVVSLNNIDADSWSNFYSKEGFVSSLVGTDYIGDREEWVTLIKKYFSLRSSQKVVLVNVSVTPLTQDMALLTSEENSEMVLKSGEKLNSKHVFSMLWKKEKEGWKIIHSHESWTDLAAK